jgi:hypothetical protein
MEPNRAEFILAAPNLAQPTVRASNKEFYMIKTVAGAALASLVLLAPSVSEAKGCIKGAVVGGVAGHYAGHHGLLGAAAGCLIGRHQANAAQRRQPAPTTR